MQIIDYSSFGDFGHISSFSRTGLGLWDMIKPDVVELGGDYIRHNDTNQLINHNETIPELINSTYHGEPAFGKFSVGTSFCAPRVSYIAAMLEKELPNENALMYRALIIQSAKLPAHCRSNPSPNDLRFYGYGIPNLNDAIDNSEKRITFIVSGKLPAKKADIYTVNIPEQLRGEGRDFKLLMEVTLAFTAKTRLTRKGAHSYLSTWLDWKSSNYNESFKSFRKRTLDYLDIDDEEEAESFESGDNPVQWAIRENPKWGLVKGVSRNNSTVQKDWTIIEPHRFDETFSLSVFGHAGWNKNLKDSIPYALCVSFEILDSEINIYQLISEAQLPIEQQVEV